MQKIDLKNKTVFVTGSAGFIGSNLVLELLRTQSPINIVGLDNMTTITMFPSKSGDFLKLRNAQQNIRSLLTSFTKATLLTKQ